MVQGGVVAVGGAAGWIKRHDHRNSFALGPVCARRRLEPRGGGTAAPRITTSVWTGMKSRKCSTARWVRKTLASFLKPNNALNIYSAQHFFALNFVCNRLFTDKPAGLIIRFNVNNNEQTYVHLAPNRGLLRSGVSPFSNSPLNCSTQHTEGKMRIQKVSRNLLKFWPLRNPTVCGGPN